MPIPPRPYKLPQTPPIMTEILGPGEKSDFTVPRTLWEYCKGCDVRIALGTGYVALAMIRDVKLKLLAQSGWQIAPKILCPKCRKGGDKILYSHPESDCVFWSDTEDTSGHCVEIGRSKVKSRLEALRLFKEMCGSEFVNFDHEMFRQQYKE